MAGSRRQLRAFPLCTVRRKVIAEFPDNATLDLDDEPAAVAAFVLWAYDASLPHEVELLDNIDQDWLMPLGTQNSRVCQQNM